MPISLQPALLRFLDNWTVRPIGSSKGQKVDVQLITATNCDLEEAISEKRFRRDLLTASMASKSSASASRTFRF